MRLEASDVLKRPERFKPDTPCVVCVPTGEVCGDLALPIVLMKLKDDLVIRSILEKDNFAAQGLEGAVDIPCNWAKAFVLCHKIKSNRGYVLIPKISPEDQEEVKCEEDYYED